MIKCNEGLLLTLKEYDKLRDEIYNYFKSKKYVIELCLHSYLAWKLLKQEYNFNHSSFCIYKDYIVKRSKFFVDDYTNSLYDILDLLKTDEKFKDSLEDAHDSKVIFKIHKNTGWWDNYHEPIFNITNSDVKDLLKIRGTEYQNNFEQLLELKKSKGKPNKEIAKQILKNI